MLWTKTVMVALLLFGAASALEIEKEGRYRLIRLGQYRADTYLLDSETGRVWQLQVGIHQGEEFKEVPFSKVQYSKVMAIDTLTTLPFEPDTVVKYIELKQPEPPPPPPPPKQDFGYGIFWVFGALGAGVIVLVLVAGAN